MYLARFNVDDECLVQGMASFPRLPRLPTQLADHWWGVYGDLLEGLPGIDGAAVALRVVLEPGEALRRALLVCGPQDDEQELRRSIAPFSRMTAMATGSLEFPHDRSAYDAVAEDFPRMTARIRNSDYVTGDVWLSRNLRIGSVLDSILIQADNYGYRLGYQVNLRPVVVDRELMRAARMNALRLRDIPGVPPELRAQQEVLAAKCAGGAMTCTEYLGADSEDAMAWIEKAIARACDQRHGSFRLDEPMLKFSQFDHEFELACPSFVSEGEVREGELCSSIVDRSGVQELLRWRPGDRLPDRLSDFAPAAVEDQVDEAVVLEDAPVPYEGLGRYVFVSYKRGDLRRIAPTIRQLQSAGVNIWYDRGIPAGAEWAATLEQRVLGAECVILFLSQAAVDSKWVRREVLFADAADKGIIGVRLDDVRLDHGMGVTLRASQLVDGAASDLKQQLLRVLAGPRAS